MADISKQPPEDSTLYENVDEGLDEQDATGEGFGQRDIEDMTVDRAELKEIGGDLEDEAQLSMLEGGIDDPDGSGPAEGAGDVDAGWDVDPVTADRRGGNQAGVGDEDDEVGEDELIPDIANDPELEVIDTDPADLEKIPDGYPNVDLDGL
ncbi:MAG TPA: hypothetical protein VGP46_09095 [Acidimicrobiales bacterium]|nr:hypothetical protein [Acidimicrobiales bacterium]